CFGMHYWLGASAPQLLTDFSPAPAAPSTVADPLAVSSTAQDHAQFPCVALTFGWPAFVTGPINHQPLRLLFSRFPLPCLTLHHPALERAFGQVQLPSYAQMPAAAPIALFGRNFGNYLLQFTALCLPAFQAQKLPQRYPTRSAVGALQPS